LLTTGAMWFVRAQYGSPMRAAQMLLQKFSSRKAPTSASGDKRVDNIRPLRQVQK
jgi:hypothetical protein